MHNNLSIICSLLFLVRADRRRWRKVISVGLFSFLAHCKVIVIHADGQTDVTKLVVAFRNFANAPYCTEYEIYTSSSEIDTDFSKERCVLMFVS